MQMQMEQSSQRKNVWVNITFFIVTALVTLIGVPIYLAHDGLPTWLAVMTSFYLVATGMSITVGYHRLYAHSTFKAHPILEFFFLFFGAAAFEQPALVWASQHRDHHRYVDTNQDPYSIKKGFFYAHIGWLIFWVHKAHYENAKDLQARPLLMNQYRYYYLWAIGSGIIFPTLLGMLFGSGVGAFIFAVCARIVIVHHATFCINSVCHMFGKATYDIYSTAKDHWLVAFITNGEGYHNFHHRFPNDYRNAVRWYQWDPSKWFIAGMQFLNLTSDLKRVSKFRILEARLKADQQRVHDWLTERKESTQWEKLRLEIEARYQTLRDHLLAWEHQSKEHAELFRGNLQERSKAIRQFAQTKVQLARKRFQIQRERWQLLIKSNAALAAAI